MDSDSDSDYSSEREWRSREEDETKSALLQDGLRKIKENDPSMKVLRITGGEFDYIDYIDESWEELGHDIADNTHLEHLQLDLGPLNDHKMSLFFRGLTRSSSIKHMQFDYNEFNAAAVQSMVPFLQNTNNLKHLDLCGNIIQSEGFNVMFRALHNSPIEEINCSCCGIESIEIDNELIPKNLMILQLDLNKINSDGCREIAKLLQEGSTIESLSLDDNKIDDEGVAILVDALKTNTCLKHLHTKRFRNDGITLEGIKSFLQLVNDVSSINATMQSNHTLRELDVIDFDTKSLPSLHTIQCLINNATGICDSISPNDLDSIGKEKIRQIQLNSCKRKEFADWQGVTRSLYSEINPLHLPEVLALVGCRHKQGELYIALKSSIAGLLSTVNRMQCLEQRRAHHEAIIAQQRSEVERIDAEIAALEEADSSVTGTLISTVNRRENIQQQRSYYASKLKELDAELVAMDDAEMEADRIEREDSRSSKRLRK